MSPHRLASFSAAIVTALTAILTVVMPAGTASAASVTAAGNRVWAISSAAHDHARADRLVSPGQRLGEAAACPFWVSGACVAPEADTPLLSRLGGPGTPHIDDFGRFASRPGQIASDTGYTVRQIKDAIHAVKADMPRSGLMRNPDVSVNTTSGNVYVMLPDGSLGVDPIGNIFDFLADLP